MNNAEKIIKSVLGNDIVPVECDVAGSTWHGWRKDLPQILVTSPPEGFRASDIVLRSWREFYTHDIRLFIGPVLSELAPGVWAESIPWDEARQDYVELGQTHIFALPDMPMLDIIDFCKTGSHRAPRESFDDRLERMREVGPPDNPFLSAMLSAMGTNEEALRESFEKKPHGETPWRYVRDALEQVDRISPFAILAAGPGTLTGIFLDQLTTEQADKVSGLILGINPEAMDGAISELERVGLPVLEHPQHKGVPDPEAAVARSLIATGSFALW